VKLSGGPSEADAAGGGGIAGIWAGGGGEWEGGAVERTEGAESCPTDGSHGAGVRSSPTSQEEARVGVGSDISEVARERLRNWCMVLWVKAEERRSWAVQIGSGEVSRDVARGRRGVRRATEPGEGVRSIRRPRTDHQAGPDLPGGNDRWDASQG